MDDRKMRRVLVAGERGVLSFDELAAERGVRVYDAVKRGGSQVDDGGCSASDFFEQVDRSRALRSYGVPATEPLAAEV